MKNLEAYLSELRKTLPDIQERLNIGANETQLETLRFAVNCPLPPQLICLYEQFNGEHMTTLFPYTTLFRSWMIWNFFEAQRPN